MYAMKRTHSVRIGSSRFLREQLYLYNLHLPEEPYESDPTVDGIYVIDPNSFIGLLLEFLRLAIMHSCIHAFMRRCGPSSVVAGSMRQDTC